MEKYSEIVYAIKFINGFNKGMYHAGCNKSPAKTLLGAQLYRSKKTALNVVNNTVNFYQDEKDVEIIPVKLEEA